MANYFARFLSAALTLSVLTHAGFAQEASSSSRLRIGFVGPLTGPAAAYGIAMKNGMELALEDLGPRRSIDVLYEDDGYDIKKTVTGLRALVERDKVDAVISLGSSPSQALAPLAQRLHVPLFAWASDPRVSSGREWVIRTYPSGQDEGRKIADEVLMRNYPSVALVFYEDDYSQSVLQGLLEKLPSRLVRLQQQVSATERDFQSLVLEIKKKSIQHVGLCLGNGQLADFAKRLRQLHVQAQLFGCITFENKDELVVAQGALEGAWFVTMEAQEAFRKRYVERYGNDSVLSGAAIHYQLILALQELASAQVAPAKFFEALKNRGETSGILPAARFVEREKDRHLQLALTVKTIQGSGFVGVARAQ